MKEMLENRRHNKIARKLNNGGKKTSEEAAFRDSMLRRMDDQDKAFNDALTGLQQSMQRFTESMTNTFSMTMQMLSNPTIGNTNLFSSFYNPQQGFISTHQRTTASTPGSSRPASGDNRSFSSPESNPTTPRNSLFVSSEDENYSFE